MIEFSGAAPGSWASAWAITSCLCMRVPSNVAPATTANGRRTSKCSTTIWANGSGFDVATARVTPSPASA